MSTGSEANQRFRARSLRSVPAWHTSILTGIGIGLLGAVVALSPAGHWIERTIASDWIFAARGIRSIPESVVVISMDERQSDLLAVTRGDRRWSRHLFATLIERLTAAGAKAVVLDVALEDATESAADKALERALSESDKVILFQRLTRTAVGDVPVPPMSRFASRAQTLGVFPLPKQSARIEYYWPFFRALEPLGASDVQRIRKASGRGQEYSLVELPSLPVAALLLVVLQERGARKFDRLINKLDHEGSGDEASTFATSETYLQAMIDLRRTAMGGLLSDERNKLVAKDRSSQEDESSLLLRSLLSVFAEPGALHLNFYGPPRTIATLEHNKVLDATQAGNGALSDAVAGKVAFVGYSDRSAVDQRDAFRTVYTSDDGVDLSGVEIAATAYANLVDDSVLRPASPGVVLLIHLLLGGATALLALHAGIVRAVVFTGALALAYVALCVQAIEVSYHLLPIAVPILLMLPLALFSALLYRHLYTRRQRDRYRSGVELMLPSRAVRDIEAARVKIALPESLHGACMITDVADYTYLSETLSADSLAGMSREYFALLSSQTELTGGELIDLEGDSMTAFWSGAESAPGNGRAAALAAVGIMQAVERFNTRHADAPFKTRIGIHAGEVSAGNIGGGQNFRHRVVGDIVNTSSRLEGLNKRLGTSVLATRAVVADAEALYVRPLGAFILKGKDEALDVVEVIGQRSSVASGTRILCARFAEALALLADGHTDSAERRFAEILRTAGDDGPARFYAELLNGRGPKDVWLEEGGVVKVDGK